MLIWKELLPEDTLDLTKIDLPFADTADAQRHVLKIDTQGRRPVMWFQADDDSNGEVKETRRFVIQGIGTGHPYTDDKWRGIMNLNSYIGTASLLGGTLIMHYFIALEEDYRKVQEEYVNSEH